MSVQDPLENLNTWSYNTNKLMDLVMKTTHLINKEEMVRSRRSSLNVFFELKCFKGSQNSWSGSCRGNRVIF